jgi:hypothetical protein
MCVQTHGSQRNVWIERQQSTSNLGHDTPSELHFPELERVFDVCYKGFVPFPKLENYHAQAMLLLLQEPIKNPIIGRNEKRLEEAIEP